jgi:hypothetical protein
VAFGIGLLEELTAFGGRRDGVKHTGICNAGFSVVGNQLVTVRGNADARKTRSYSHSIFLREPGSCLNVITTQRSWPVLPQGNSPSAQRPAWSSSARLRGKARERALRAASVIADQDSREPKGKVKPAKSA